MRTTPLVRLAWSTLLPPPPPKQYLSPLRPLVYSRNRKPTACLWGSEDDLHLCAILTRMPSVGRLLRLRPASSQGRAVCRICCACALPTPTACRLTVICTPALRIAGVSAVAGWSQHKGCGGLGRLGPLSVYKAGARGCVCPLLFQGTSFLCSCDYLLWDWYPALPGIGSLPPW